MGNNITKWFATRIFGVSDKIIPKTACSATESSQNYEISLVAYFDIILSNKRTTKTLIRLADVQAGLRIGCSQTTEDRVSRVEVHMYLLIELM